MKKLIWIGLIVAGLGACGRSTPTGSGEPASPNGATAADSRNHSPQAAASPAREIATVPLTAEPIQISLADLPEPYASESASQSPQVVPVPDNPQLQAPEGFTVNVFAEELDAPRWLALTPSGEVLVTETRANRIRLLKDTDGDGTADQVQTFATTDNGLDIPFGMAFTEGAFYLGNSDEVRRYDYTSGQNQLSGTGAQIATLPGGGYRQHWTRNVVVSPDGQTLYVSIGSRSNASEEPLPRASVQVMDLDGSNQQTYAYGLRNPVGLDFHPITGSLYTTVNERDGIGDDLVPDYLTRIQAGEFYGWPYAYLQPDWLDPRLVSNGQSLKPDLAAQTRTPDVLFQAHSAALGLQFYTGDTFPERYQNGAFVAFRGSWNRSQGTGYKLVFVPFGDDHRPVGSYEDFVTGFLIDPAGPTTWGRPVGVLVMPDGSLLFTEEMNGRIYRVQYQTP
ncbi:sorbosone dehydrogenase [filamentous cyanobacterium CCP5]|nr:sorbosone dehydrogenase [filamentous cyanobacterium CCP5]